MKKYFLLITLLFTMNVIKAQEANNTSTKFQHLNNIQAEAGGYGLIYAINYERFIINDDRFKTSVQIGFGYSPPSFNVIGFRFPIAINQLYSINQHHIEIGVGATYVRDDYKNEGINVDGNGF